MSEYSPTWCTELYGILIHSRELRILMLWGAAGWSLPQMSLDQAVWEADVGKVSEAMRLALGAEVTTLRYASYSVSVDAHQIDAIYVLVSHTPAWEPQAASSLPLFAHEPAVMRGLAGLYPDHIPAPLSIDEQHRWMLLADFGAPIEWDAPVEVQEEMLRRYGEVQRDAGGRPAGDRVPGPPPRTARSAGRPVAGGHSDACQPTGCGGDRATPRSGRSCRRCVPSWRATPCHTLWCMAISIWATSHAPQGATYSSIGQTPV